MSKSGYAGHTFLTAGIGAVVFIVVEALRYLLIDVLDFYTPASIAICFAVYAGIMFAVMYALCKARKDYEGWVKKNLSSVVSKAYKFAAIALAVLIVLSGVFEFLYEIESIGTGNSGHPTSYIFLVDDSSSMGGNDFGFERVTAIEKIMSEEDDVPYAVYKYEDDVTLVRDMKKFDENEPSVMVEFEADGLTATYIALNTVLDDIQNKKYNAGASPVILLLTDGSNTDYDDESVIDRCRSMGVVVSTIGFTFDSEELRKIAEETGGVYTSINDVTDFENVIRSSIVIRHDHNLLSYRRLDSVAHMIMRIGFLIILGVIWAWIKQKTYCSAYDHKFANTIFWVSAILCAVGAILVEVLFMLLPDRLLFGVIIRFLFFVLWSATPGFFVSGTQYANYTNGAYDVNVPSAFSSGDKRF